MLEVSLQVFGGRKEHEVITCADREPGEREIRPDRFNRFAAVTYFNDHKSVGSDRANEKNTFVTVLGLERSRALVEELTGQAEQALSGFGDPGFLLCLARALAGRRS